VGRRRIKNESLFQRNRRDGPAFRAEPARSGELGSVETVEGRGDFPAADLDGDRLRYRC
jgi:hypothetical protein